jgi:hypothetical protein
MSYRGSLALFADDFQTPPPPPPPGDAEPERAPAPPSYGQDDLDAACARARADGYAEGVAEAERSTAAQVAATISRIGDLMAEAGASAARVAEAGAETMTQLLMAGMLAGYPELRKRHGADELRAVIRKSMPGMLLEPKVVFHVHPSMVELVTAELAALRPDQRGHMSIEPIEEIPPGDARITWPDGAAVRDTATIHTAIAEILGPLGLLPDPAPMAGDGAAR